MFKIIKYSFIVSYFAFLITIISTVNSKCTTFNDIFYDIQENYYLINKLSYNVTITKKESNNNIILYNGNTYEEWDKKNSRHYVFIRFKNNQILFSYDDSLGINRYWFGSNLNLPEIKSTNIDSRILDTSIMYSTFLINPLWLTIPYKSKLDHGFLVITTKNKDKFSSLSRIDFYINKNNIPIRILYYNNISDLPVIEIIVKHYEIFNKEYLIDDLIYKDNLNKIYTEVKKTGFKFNQDVVSPIGFNKVKESIESNIKVNYRLYLNSILNNNIAPKSNINKITKNIDSNITNYSDKDEAENKSNRLLLEALKSLKIKKKYISPKKEVIKNKDKKDSNPVSKQSKVSHGKKVVIKKEAIKNKDKKDSNPVSKQSKVSHGKKVVIKKEVIKNKDKKDSNPVSKQNNDLNELF